MVRQAQPGTTSACAENTRYFLGCPCRCWNYLRVRGEYIEHVINAVHPVELPPRARRILWLRINDARAFGTTSACAENTMRKKLYLADCWNYLRVRGEYNCSVVAVLLSRELPPRARRIRLLKPNPIGHIGTTSACAENTR